jgi:hypothetical protein
LNLGTPGVVLNERRENRKSPLIKYPKQEMKGSLTFDRIGGKNNIQGLAQNYPTDRIFLGGFAMFLLKSMHEFVGVYKGTFGSWHIRGFHMS